MMICWGLRRRSWKMNVHFAETHARIIFAQKHVKLPIGMINPKNNIMYFYFNKPKVILPRVPKTNIWLQSEYDAIFTQEELIEFTLQKLDDALNCDDRELKQSLEFLAFPLYSYLTNKSYQSKLTI